MTLTFVLSILQDEDEKPKDKLHQIAYELLTTERAYVSRLHLLDQVWAHFPLLINITVTYSYRLLDSLVLECWLRVREVPGSIPSQGPRHTKDVIKMVPVVPLLSTQH